jgi:hypothetical protein
LNWRLAKIEEKIISVKPMELDINTMARMSERVKFSKNDSLEIQSQLEINNRYKYDSTLFSGKSFREKIETERSYIKISRPIFFDNGRKLWVYVEHYCPGTCGHGVIKCYGADKTGYKLLFTIGTWMS